MAIPVLAGAIAKAATRVLAERLADGGKKVAPVVTTAIVNDLVTTVTGDPVVRNEMNAERPWQSRVAVGSVVSALGVLVPIGLGLFGFDVSADRVVEISGAVVTLVGAGYALYGRFKSGLKPLFSRG